LAFGLFRKGGGENNYLSNANQWLEGLHVGLGWVQNWAQGPGPKVESLSILWAWYELEAHWAQKPFLTGWLDYKLLSK